MTRARDLGDFIADGGAPELVVDTTTLVVDSTNNRVGVGTASPATALDVVGNATITITDNSNALSLVSTDADADIGPVLEFNRNSSSPSVNDQLGRIDVVGKNDAGQDVDYVRIVNMIRDASDGSEDGRFSINTITSGALFSRLNIEPTETVFNDESYDVDFRIETNAQANAFVIDGANDTITMTNQVVTITHGGNGKQLELVSTDADGSSGPQLDLFRNSASPADTDYAGVVAFRGKNSADEEVNYANINLQLGDVTDGTEDGTLSIQTIVGGTVRDRVNFRSSGTVFNDEGQDIDFRVESDNNTHMLFVDAGNDAVGINNSSPSSYLTGNLVVGNSSSDQYLSIVSGSSNAAGLMFQDTTGTSIVGGVRYTHSDNVQSFWTNGSERFRIASSGELGIGGATYGTAGQVLTSGGSGAAPTWADAASGGTAFSAF